VTKIWRHGDWSWFRRPFHSDCNYGDTRAMVIRDKRIGDADTRAMLTPEDCWYQRLASGVGWHQELAGTRSWLAPGVGQEGWHQNFADAGGLGTRNFADTGGLAPELC
jgi:hypothetical protein